MTAIAVAATRLLTFYHGNIVSVNRQFLGASFWALLLLTCDNVKTVVYSWRPAVNGQDNNS